MLASVASLNVKSESDKLVIALVDHKTVMFLCLLNANVLFALHRGRQIVSHIFTLDELLLPAVLAPIFPLSGIKPVRSPRLTHMFCFFDTLSISISCKEIYLAVVTFGGTDWMQFRVGYIRRRVIYAANRRRCREFPSPEMPGFHYS